VSGILEAVDNVIKVHDAWVADDSTGRHNIPPRELEEAFEQLFRVAGTADMPASQRVLFKSVEAFQKQWDAYTNGQAKANAEPFPQFWDALRAVFHERTVSFEMKPKRPESVATLRRQKVSDSQIANHIYGWRGEGPFLDHGRVMPELIDKEEREPGSVVPADWVHPTELQRLRDYHIAVDHRLASLSKLAEEPQKPRETVEGMLREGANIEQICKCCGVTEEQVRKVGEVLGIEPKFRENVASMRGTHDAPENEAAGQAIAVDTHQAARTAPVTEKPAKEPTDDVRAHVIELAEGNPDMGAAEIAAEIGKIKPHKVAQILEEHRKATAGSSK
jgi:hypothetical protein